jgi:hypothetical protein
MHRLGFETYGIGDRNSGTAARTAPRNPARAHADDGFILIDPDPFGAEAKAASTEAARLAHCEHGCLCRGDELIFINVEQLSDTILAKRAAPY